MSKMVWVNLAWFALVFSAYFLGILVETMNERERQRKLRPTNRAKGEKE